MPSAIDQVQPPLEFIPPAFNPLVLQVSQSVLPFWLRYRTSITHIQTENVDQLVELYRQFQAGKVRFLMAFRHPSTDDPFCMAHLLANVAQVAKQQQAPLQPPVHAHFIYDRGIPLWAGSQVSWLYSRLGGTPIHRGKVDRVGLRSARNLFFAGRFPIVAAPEGATNGHNELVSPLEPGIAQLGFWCVEDLVKAGRSEQVFIVPIGIQYRYMDAPWQRLEALLSELEAATGMMANSPPSQELSEKFAGMDQQKAIAYQRLYRLGEHLLTVMEQFYARFYPRSRPATASATAIDSSDAKAGTDAALPSTPQSAQEFTDRLNALLDTALNVSEQYFGLEPRGTFIDRCRRIEQAGWDWIYREDLKPGELPPLEKGLADRIAEEASLRMWHMRLVESFVAVTGRYVLEKPTVERFAETTLLMWDTIARIKGNNPFQRPTLGKQRVLMTVGEPISVSERWETYQANRRSAKQAIATLTQDLQNAMQSMIV